MYWFTDAFFPRLTLVPGTIANNLFLGSLLLLTNVIAYCNIHVIPLLDTLSGFILNTCHGCNRTRGVISIKVR